MTQTENNCALCNLPVRVQDFRLWKRSGETLDFCCDACMGVYQMLHESELKDEPKSTPKPEPRK